MQKEANRELTLTLTPTMVTVITMAMENFRDHGMPDKPVFGCDVSRVVDGITTMLDYMSRLVELERQGNREAYELVYADMAVYEAGMLAEMEKYEEDQTNY